MNLLVALPSCVVNLTTTLSDSSPDNTATDTTAIPSLSLTLYMVFTNPIVAPTLEENTALLRTQRSG